MTLTRRAVLQGAAAGGIIAAAPTPGLAYYASPAAARVDRMLIVVHLRGGADGLNLVSPATDPNFIAARSSELRVAADGPDAGYPLANSPDARIDFRLHAAAGGLAELYKGGTLSFIHAVGLTDGTRSHFVATDMIDRGVADDTGLGRTSDGWLARHLRQGGHPVSGIQAVSASSVMGGEFMGWPNALAVPDLGGGFMPAGGAQTQDVLTRLYAAGTDKTGAAAAGRAALATMAFVNSRIPRDTKGAVIAYRPDDGQAYDSAGEFGRPLKTLAQLIKMDIGLEAASVDIGGWDTHEYQPGRFKGAVTQLSNGIAAFWNNTQRYHDRMILVTISEFGRRLRSNRSQGTDHGRAGVMMVMGEGVRGGRFHGPWPGLDNAHLDEGVDLAVATDYRQVLSEVLRARGGAATGPEFPGFTPSRPLGIFAA